MKRGFKLWVAALITALVILLATAYSVGNLNCLGSLRRDQLIEIGGSKIYIQKAESYADMQQGLGGKDCIDANEGMLFIFDAPGYYPFWMKDMRFSIDIIWLSADKKVVDLETTVEPSTYPRSFVNDKPADYVLELKAGQTAKLNINLETQVTF